ncbi:hypothetical protein F442_04922 [Phytophthora nicotianae P10297]|uniref:Uncharacterized protein n=2 Tax=Phytophthora nicotianae TaxID=4792 RepID=W2ZRC9_PHYNI|nr:hypothetical protein F444_04890 [Phytophthora nicotianae P1976]ETP49575.1 hypothetical protein F442_04922 [Phytophthora nicotianae P10297]
MSAHSVKSGAFVKKRNVCAGKKSGVNVIKIVGTSVCDPRKLTVATSS